MNFTDLEPILIKLEIREGREYHVIVESIQEADGVQFLCPKCYIQNKGTIGTHSILCFKPHIPLTITPGPGRWNLVGPDLAHLSLVANSSSISLSSGCMWHGYVENGLVRDA